MKAVHFGAGNIGRGLIGYVLFKNDYEINFIDTNKNLINELKNNKQYEIELINQTEDRLLVQNVEAYNSLTETEKVEELIVRTDLITTSVGIDNLRKIAPIIKEGLIQRTSTGKPIHILANENTINASSVLMEEIKKISTAKEWNSIEYISYFVNTSIDRQALSKHIETEDIPLVEPYYEWVIDKSQVNRHQPLKLDNVTMVENLIPYIERKLFIVNAEHAAFSYLGFLFNHQTIQEAAEDERILKFIRKYLDEIKKYFIEKYNMNEQELDEYINRTIIRHTNPLLKDPIERVGRNPVRKLGSKDRLVSPLIKLSSLGLENYLCKIVVAAGYLYENKSDTQATLLKKMINENGIYNTVKIISGLSHEQIMEIVDLYEQLNENTNSVIEKVIS